MGWAGMKITVDIGEGLLKEAHEIAERENTSLQSLIVAGLRLLTKEHRRDPPFRLRDLSYPGEGRQSEFAGASWQQIRAAAYGESNI